MPEIKIRDPLELQIKSTATSAATAKNMLPHPPAEHSVKKLDIKESPVILPRVKEAMSIRTKPPEQAEVRTAPNVVKTEAYVEA